jgi:hypothetical protein
LRLWGVIGAIVAAIVLFMAAVSGTGAAVPRPNPALTPGAVFADATPDVFCAAGYTAKVRNVSAATRAAVLRLYGWDPETTRKYELDHLIPLELGGSNDAANLWPEPGGLAYGFARKDRLENALHRLVCTGQLDYREAQQAIAADWWAAYLRWVGPR